MNAHGCGLGLSIAKRITNALGGEILVESEVDQGTTFSLIFGKSFSRNSLE
jgi:signal transduction histidine kinase